MPIKLTYGNGAISSREIDTISRSLESFYNVMSYCYSV
jgi:hypothetical protein